VRASDTGTMTLLHGDAHVGNTYLLPGNAVGFYDWQHPRIGSWEHDVGYFLVSALAIEDRRSHERELIDRYLAGLAKTGVQVPSHAEAWLRYRRTPAYGLGVWLTTLGVKNYQRHENSLACIERFAAASMDLDTEQAISLSQLPERKGA
jgi:aminoglycoside phosphotransferase (APT) family kinase protein